jgi:hypothetical protein
VLLTFRIRMLKYFVRKTNKQKKRTDLLISPLSLRHILNASFERSFRRVCQFFVGVSNHYFCETRPKRSVEVYKGKNLHPPTDRYRHFHGNVRDRYRYLRNTPITDRDRDIQYVASQKSILLHLQYKKLRRVSHF